MIALQEIHSIIHCGNNIDILQNSEQIPRYANFQKELDQDIIYEY